jgi:drug/metabolite transporter, DME family
VLRHGLGSLMIAACALSWGFIAIIVRELDMPALAIVFYRVLLSAGAIALALLALRRHELLRPPPLPVIALGVLLGAHWCFFFASIKETSVASAVLVTYTGPILIALIAPALIGERVPRVTIGALAASAAGIVLVTAWSDGGGGAVEPVGVGLAVLAALTFAVLIVLLKKYSAEVDPVTVVVYEDGVAALLLAPAAVLADYELGAPEVGYLLILGVLLSAVAGIAYVTALRSVAATTAGVLTYVEPVSAAVLAAILLGEGLTPGVVIGGAAIVAAGIAVAVRAPDPAAGSAVEEPVAAHPR